MPWRVPTTKHCVSSSPNVSPKFLKFSSNKSIFSPKVLSLANVLASSNRKESCKFSPKFLAKGVKFGECLSEFIFQYTDYIPRQTSRQSWSSLAKKNHHKNNRNRQGKTFWRAPTAKDEVRSRQTFRQTSFLAEKK